MGSIMMYFQFLFYKPTLCCTIFFSSIMSVNRPVYVQIIKTVLLCFSLVYSANMCTNLHIYISFFPLIINYLLMFFSFHFLFCQDKVGCDNSGHVFTAMTWPLCLQILQYFDYLLWTKTSTFFIDLFAGIALIWFLVWPCLPQLRWNVVRVHENQVPEHCGRSPGCQRSHTVHRRPGRFSAVLPRCDHSEYVRSAAFPRSHPAVRLFQRKVNAKSVSWFNERENVFDSVWKRTLRT